MWDLLFVLAISHVLAFYTAYLRDKETEAESSLVTCSFLAPLCLAYSQSVGLSFTWKHGFVVFFFTFCTKDKQKKCSRSLAPGF